MLLCRVLFADMFFFVWRIRHTTPTLKPCILSMMNILLCTMRCEIACTCQFVSIFFRPFSMFGVRWCDVHPGVHPVHPTGLGVDFSFALPSLALLSTLLGRWPGDAAWSIQQPASCGKFWTQRVCSISFCTEIQGSCSTWRLGSHGINILDPLGFERNTEYTMPTLLLYPLAYSFHNTY